MSRAQVDRFVAALAGSPAAGAVVVVGRSMRAIELDVVSGLLELRDAGLDVARRDFHSLLVLGRKVWLADGSDPRTVHRVRGLDVALAFVDGFVPEGGAGVCLELLSVLESRLRSPGARLLHW